VGGVIAGHIYLEILVDIAPVYFGASLTVCLALLILLFYHKKLFTHMVMTLMGVTAVTLATIFCVRPYIEPWVSCKNISDIFTQIERSNAPVLSSKFYVRGIRYYTDRPMAVMDIGGKGFWSPHPIPYIDKEHLFLQLVNSQPVTWAILKESNVEDVHRILQNSYFKITELADWGGKYIVKIEKAG
jgi:hypothetical protein